MNVSPEHKITLLQKVMDPLFESLAEGAPDGEVTADDVVDFLAMGIASVLDNDTHIVTPRDVRKNTESVGKLVQHHVAGFRAIQEKTGASMLSVMLASGERDRAGVPN